MDRSKLVAIATGAIAVLLSVAYLLLVQLLDFRGEMKPAPIGEQSSDRAVETVVNWTLSSDRPVPQHQRSVSRKPTSSIPKVQPRASNL
jgi:hypothetical protein